MPPAYSTYEQVYDEYFDTAGNYHYIGIYSGEHIIRLKEEDNEQTGKDAVKRI